MSAFCDKRINLIVLGATVTEPCHTLPSWSCLGCHIGAAEAMAPGVLGNALAELRREPVEYNVRAGKPSLDKQPPE